MRGVVTGALFWGLTASAAVADESDALKDANAMLENIISEEEILSERDTAKSMLGEALTAEEKAEKKAVREAGMARTQEEILLGAAAFELPTDEASLAIPPLERMTSLVPDDLYPYFDLYLYVNKSDKGIWSQQMYIYEIDRSGEAPEFALKHRWLVSTGREKMERHFTTTPTGIFQLDDERFYPSARSYRWDGVAMPWAMFFDYSYTSRKSGYAIHAAIPEYEEFLGTRASAGCVRLYLKHAQDLFNLVRKDYAGEVPKFAFDADGKGTTFRDGTLDYTEAGEPMMQAGYRVLVIIDDKTVAPAPVARP